MNKFLYKHKVDVFKYVLPILYKIILTVYITKNINTRDMISRNLMFLLSFDTLEKLI